MTDAVKEVLPRGEISGAEELLLEFSQGIDEVVNYGTHLFDKEVKGEGGDENLPVSMMFRHFLELIDAIAILVKQSSIDPAKLLLRAALETFLGLEYLLVADTKKRSLAFLIWHYHQELKRCKKFTPGEETYKELESKLKSDKSTSPDFKPPVIPDLEKHIKLLEQILALPLYAEAESEYQRLVASGVKNPSWYEFYNGPKSLDALAAKLNRHGIYDILYRAWSGPVHGTDIIQGKLSKAADGRAEVVQIRNPKDAQLVTTYAFQLPLMVYHLITDKRLPEEKVAYAKWYNEVIRSGFNQLSTEKLLITE